MVGLFVSPLALHGQDSFILCLELAFNIAEALNERSIVALEGTLDVLLVADLATESPVVALQGINLRLGVLEPALSIVGIRNQLALHSFIECLISDALELALQGGPIFRRIIDTLSEQSYLL